MCMLVKASSLPVYPGVISVLARRLLLGSDLLAVTNIFPQKAPFSFGACSVRAADRVGYTINHFQPKIKQNARTGT